MIRQVLDKTMTSIIPDVHKYVVFLRNEYTWFHDNWMEAEINWFNAKLSGKERNMHACIELVAFFYKTWNSFIN